MDKCTDKNSINDPPAPFTHSGNHDMLGLVFDKYILHTITLQIVNVCDTIYSNWNSPSDCRRHNYQPPGIMINSQQTIAIYVC